MIFCMNKLRNIDFNILGKRINRIRTFDDLRYWDKWEIENIISRRRVRYSSRNDIISYINNLISDINLIITDEVLITARNRSRFVGNDVSYILKCPSHIDINKWSSTVVETFLMDWYSHVIIESVFSISFRKTIDTKKKHIKAFYKFIMTRSFTQKIKPSRSCIEWCKYHLDGKWKNRQYGESVTKKLLESLPKIIAWADIILKKRSAFNSSDYIRAIDQIELMSIKSYDCMNTEEKQHYQNTLKFIYNGLKIRDSDYSFGNRIYYGEDTVCCNGTDGIIALQFLDFYNRNPDLCFIFLLEKIIGDASYKNRNKEGCDGYNLSNSFLKPAISSIKRQRINLKDIKIDYRRLPWNSIILDLYTSKPLKTTYPVIQEALITSSLRNKVYHDFINMKPAKLQDTFSLHDAVLMRTATLGYFRKRIRPSLRREFWRNVTRFMKNKIPFIFTDAFSRKIFASKLTSDDIVMIIQKLTDLVYSGRLINFFYKHRADGLQDCYIVMNVIEKYIKNNLIYNGDKALFCSLSTKPDSVKYKTRFEILNTFKHTHDLSSVFCISNHGYFRRHQDFMSCYRPLTHELKMEDGKLVSTPKYDMLFHGIRNSQFWDKWRSIRPEYSCMNEGLDFFMFIGRMQMWSTHVARSLLGFDTDGYTWLPNLMTCSDQKNKKQRLNPNYC